MPPFDLADLMATAEKCPGEGSIFACFTMHTTDLVVLFAGPALQYVSAVPPVTFPPVYSISDMSGPRFSSGAAAYGPEGRFPPAHTDGLTTRVGGPKRIGTRVDGGGTALGPGNQTIAWEVSVLLDISLYPANSSTVRQSGNPTPRLEAELYEDGGTLVAQARIPLQVTGALGFESSNANSYGMIMLQGNGPTLHDGSIPAVYAISVMVMPLIP